MKDDAIEALRALCFFDMGLDEDEGHRYTTQEVWETVFENRVEDWFSFEDFDRARQIIAAHEAQPDSGLVGAALQSRSEVVAWEYERNLKGRGVGWTTMLSHEQPCPPKPHENEVRNIRPLYAAPQDGWRSDIPMFTFVNNPPKRDERRGEQAFLTYSEASGTWDVETIETGWDDDLSGLALGNTHWLDITEMFPKSPAQGEG